MSEVVPPRIDYTSKDYASLRQAMLDLAKEKLPEWTDYSPNDLGVVLVELFAYMGDLLMYYQDRIANESYLDTAVEPHSITNLLRLIGYEIRPTRPATAGLVLKFEKTAPLKQPEFIIDEKIEFKTKETFAGKKVSFRYLGMPIKIAWDTLPVVKEKDGEEYLRYPGSDNGTLPVVQVDEWVMDESPGSSNGTPLQQFTLAKAPVIAETLKVKINAETWQQKPSLLGSYSKDKHYTLVRDASEHTSLVFGDGKFGMIPLAGQKILVSYGTGGGSKGNLPKDAINDCTVKSGIKPKIVSNPDQASGGNERESLSEATHHGPKVYRALGRAVTAEDYVSLARQFGAAKALVRDASSNTLIELYVAPAGGGYPTDGFIHDIYSYFEQRRMLTTRLAVKGPQYVPVEIEGQLEVEPYFSTNQVTLRVQEAVRHLLAFDQVDFGCTFYLSKFYEAAETVEGVKGITISKFTAKSDHGIPVGNLSFGWNEIPIAAYPEGIKLKVTGGRDDR